MGEFLDKFMKCEPLPVENSEQFENLGRFLGGSCTAEEHTVLNSESSRDTILKAIEIITLREGDRVIATKNGWGLWCLQAFKENDTGAINSIDRGTQKVSIIWDKNRQISYTRIAKQRFRPLTTKELIEEQAG